VYNMSDAASSPDSDISCYSVVTTTPDAGILNVRRESNSPPGAPNGHDGCTFKARYTLQECSRQHARDCASSLHEDRQVNRRHSIRAIMTFTGLKKKKKVL
jgi:hypothetical protein